MSASVAPLPADRLPSAPWPNGSELSVELVCLWYSPVTAGDQGETRGPAHRPDLVVPGRSFDGDRNDVLRGGRRELMHMQYRVISTDDHLQEGPETWTSRMSKANWGSKIPQVRQNEDGTDSWYIFDRKRPGVSVAIVSGAMTGPTPDGRGPAHWSEVPRSTYVAADRIEAMERDGVDVHTFFGNLTGVAGNTFSSPDYPDELFRLECIQAFNDHQIEDWATPFPGRFITLAVLPMWDVDLATAELLRMVNRGIKGLSFAFPQQYGYKHISDRYWDPLWALAQETDLSVNFHIGSGASMGMAPQTHAANFWGERGARFQMAESATVGVSSNIQVMATILFSGILERFPQLKIVSSESGLGWVPFILENADHQWTVQKLGDQGMPIRPSEYFHRQCYVNFWFEVTGTRLRDTIGVGNILWESDFPHPTGTFPDSKSYIQRGMQDWTPQERHQVLVETPVKLYHLDR